MIYNKPIYIKLSLSHVGFSGIKNIKTLNVTKRITIKVCLNLYDLQFRRSSTKPTVSTQSMYSHTPPHVYTYIHSHFHTFVHIFIHSYIHLHTTSLHIHARISIQANLLIVRLLIVKLLIVTRHLLLIVTSFTSVYLSQVCLRNLTKLL